MRRIILILSCILLAGVDQSAAADVFYDDFGDDVRALGRTSLVKWTLKQGNVDVINPGEYVCPGDWPGKCIDLDGSFTSTLAYMETRDTFALSPGKVYRIVLRIPALSGGGTQHNDSFRLSVGDSFSETFRGYAAPLVIDRTFTVSEAETARIGIQMLDGRNYFGPFMTEVALSELEGEGCISASTRLCLLNGRFSATLRWNDGGGDGLRSAFVATPKTDGNTAAAGLFYFYEADPDNWEVLVKVINGCATNGRFWLLVSASTGFGWELVVRDEATGASKVVEHPVDGSASGVADFEAFVTCGG